MKVRFSKRAKADLRSIVDTISEQNPSAARRFGQLLWDRASSLGDHPQSGAPILGHSTARRLVVKPYIIVYRSDQAFVQILRILHGRRDINTLMLRMSQPRRDEG